MAELILSNIEHLVQSWLEAERNGDRFPVPFDMAWQIAGYSRKDSAKRKLSKRKQGKTFHISVETVPHSTGASKKEVITLSCDGLKDLALLADTEAGDLIRQYFIEAEKKWRMVQENHPQVAEDIEGKRLDQMIQLEELRYKNTKLACDMATMHGKPYAMIVLGRDDQLVEIEKPTIEVIDDRHNVSFKGQTLKQVADYLSKKTGQKFKNGTDVKRELNRQGLAHLVCSTPRSVLAEYIPQENLAIVYDALDKGSRQLKLGE